jgi:ABC-type sulfate transport system substrate-binding protein
MKRRRADVSALENIAFAYQHALDGVAVTTRTALGILGGSGSGARSVSDGRTASAVHLCPDSLWTSL